MPSNECDPRPRDTTSTARAQLRMVRVHAEHALGEKDRRGGDAGPLAPGRDAHSIARAQLHMIAEVQGDVVEPLVLDIPALESCPHAEATVIRTFAVQILQQRRAREAHDKVFFRREDLDTLSGLLHCPSDDVTPLLGRLGVLALTTA